jgi:hypothetical protein
MGTLTGGIRKVTFTVAVMASLGFGIRSAAAEVRPERALAFCGTQDSHLACAECCSGKAAGGSHWNPNTRKCTCIF